jgi:hypothetical protein
LPERLVSEVGPDSAISELLLTAGFVGYIIGLGDRHGSNILVDQLTWGALHIDFGDVSDMFCKICLKGWQSLIFSSLASHKNAISCLKRSPSA